MSKLTWTKYPHLVDDLPTVMTSRAKVRDVQWILDGSPAVPMPDALHAATVASGVIWNRVIRFPALFVDLISKEPNIRSIIGSAIALKRNGFITDFAVIPFDLIPQMVSSRGPVAVGGPGGVQVLDSVIDGVCLRDYSHLEEAVVFPLV